MSSRRPVAPAARRPTGVAAASARSAARSGARSAGRTTARTTPRPAPRNASRPAAGRTPARRTTAAPRAAVERHEQPRQVTVRSVMLFVVVLVAFVVLAPTLRAYLSQQQQLRDLDDQITAAQDRNAYLEVEIERWSDDAYVQAQARDRLGFVLPGETPYVVVDPETVTGEEPADSQDPGPVTMPRTGPWYLTVWDSVLVAGEVDD